VVLGPCHHLCTCCCCLATCRHCMSWSCPCFTSALCHCSTSASWCHGAASLLSVIVPCCCCYPCPGCVIIVPCCHAVSEQGGLGQTKGGTYHGALTTTTNDDSWLLFIILLSAGVLVVIGASDMALPYCHWWVRQWNGWGHRGGWWW